MLRAEHDLPVNSREKPDNLRILRGSPYIASRLAAASDSTKIRSMRFTPQFLDELRARLPVSEIVGRRVKLKKSGREWKGLSPFQQEKTPSFFVNDQKQAWFDFSSGKNGNIFDFLVQTEGLSFPEAVERLAAMAGLPLPAATPDAAPDCAGAPSLPPKPVALYARRISARNSFSFWASACAFCFSVSRPPTFK